MKVIVTSGRSSSFGECERYCAEWPAARQVTPSECVEHARRTGHTVYRLIERGTYYRAEEKA